MKVPVIDLELFFQHAELYHGKFHSCFRVIIFIISTVWDMSKPGIGSINCFFHGLIMKKILASPLFLNFLNIYLSIPFLCLTHVMKSKKSLKMPFRMFLWMIYR